MPYWDDKNSVMVQQWAWHSSVSESTWFVTRCKHKKTNERFTSWSLAGFKSINNHTQRGVSGRCHTVSALCWMHLLLPWRRRQELLEWMMDLLSTRPLPWDQVLTSAEPPREYFIRNSALCGFFSTEFNIDRLPALFVTPESWGIPIKISGQLSLDYFLPKQILRIPGTDLSSGWCRQRRGGRERT